MDPLFWILSGVVTGCLIGIIIIWRLEKESERQLAAQRLAEGDSSASLPVVDPRAELEEMDTRPLPAAPGAISSRPALSGLAPNAAGSPASSQASAEVNGAASHAEPWAPRIHIRPEPTRPPVSPPQGPAIPQAEEPLDGSLDGIAPAILAPPAPIEELATEKLPSLAASADPRTVWALEDRPTEKLPGQAPPAQRVPTSEAAPAPAPEAQETLEATPEQARLRLAELARERLSLTHTLEANQIKLDELERGSASPGSEEALAITLFQGEIAQQRQRLQAITTLEGRYRQGLAATAEQSPRQPPASPSAVMPRAFGVRRMSLAPVEQEEPEPAAPPIEAATDSEV